MRFSIPAILTFVLNFTGPGHVLHSLFQDAEKFYASGLEKQKKGDLEGSLADFTKAIELDPAYVQAYHGRGVTRHFKGDLDAAIADYSKAIELDPKVALAYHDRALT